MAWIIGGAAVGSALLGASAAKDASGKQGDATGKAVAETQREFNQSRTDLAPYREAGSAALSRLRSLLGISSGIDETDPRYKQFYNDAVNNFNTQHQEKYRGMSIWDPKRGYGGALPQHEQEILKQQALDKFRAQYPDEVSGAGPGASGSSQLLSKFTQADLTADPVYNSGLQFGLDEGTKAIERRAQAGGGYDSGATLKALTRFGNDYGSTKAGESYGRFRDYQDTTYNKLAGIAGMGSGATSVGVGANTAAGTNLAGLYTGQGNADAAASIARTNAITGAGNNAMGYYYLNKLSGGGQRSVAPIDYSTAGS